MTSTSGGGKDRAMGIVAAAMSTGAERAGGAVDSSGAALACMRAALEAVDLGAATRSRRAGGAGLERRATGGRLGRGDMGRVLEMDDDWLEKPGKEDRHNREQFVNSF